MRESQGSVRQRICAPNGGRKCELEPRKCTCMCMCTKWRRTCESEPMVCVSALKLKIQAFHEKLRL